MKSRGPDGAGLYVDGSGTCLLGHRRLAIIDLSEAAAQPMSTADGRFTITFNGEIYNYRALRSKLIGEGALLRTESDTEVLLELYRREGRGMTDHLRGMFAFALWDSQSRRLFLARDPHGIKPLYYADDGQTFRFASSVKALANGGGVSRAPDAAAVVGFLGWGSIPEPATAFRSIRALTAGSTLEVGEQGASSPSSYWTVKSVYEQARHSGRAGADSLREEIRQSVAAHLVADVPVGLFLSAGVDSGALLGIASELHPEPLRTVTLGFESFAGTTQDEAPFAEMLARQYGATHRTVVVSEEQFRRDVDAFQTAMDQPTIDGLNTYLVAKAVRETGLKAAMSGLGGDELFGGYSTFRNYPLLRRLRTMGRLPGATFAFRRLAQFAHKQQRAKLGALPMALRSKARTFQLLRGLFTPEEVRALVAPDVWAEAGGETAILGPVENAWGAANLSPWSEVSIAEQAIYMRNQLLRDADWASMASGLEVRLPLVDRQMTESVGLALARAPHLGKKPLSTAPALPLPEGVRSRSKTGFFLPMRKWMAGMQQSHALSAGPPWLIHMSAGTAIAEAARRGDIHWSRSWAIHVLGRWFAELS